MSSYVALFVLCMPVPFPNRETEPKPEVVQPKSPGFRNPIQILLGIPRLQVLNIEHRVHFDYSIHERWPTRNLDLNWFHLELFLRFRSTPQDISQIHDWCTEVFGNSRTPEGIVLYCVEARAWGQDAIILLVPSNDAQRDLMTSRYLGFRNSNNQLLPTSPSLISISPELARYILHDQTYRP